MVKPLFENRREATRVLTSTQGKNWSQVITAIFRSSLQNRHRSFKKDRDQVFSYVKQNVCVKLAVEETFKSHQHITREYLHRIQRSQQQQNDEKPCINLAARNQLQFPGVCEQQETSENSSSQDISDEDFVESQEECGSQFSASSEMSSNSTDEESNRNDADSTTNSSVFSEANENWESSLGPTGHAMPYIPGSLSSSDEQNSVQDDDEENSTSPHCHLNALGSAGLSEPYIPENESDGQSNDEKSEEDPFGKDLNNPAENLNEDWLPGPQCQSEIEFSMKSGTVVEESALIAIKNYLCRKDNLVFNLLNEHTIEKATFKPFERTGISTLQSLSDSMATLYQHCHLNIIKKRTMKRRGNLKFTVTGHCKEKNCPVEYRIAIFSLNEKMYKIIVLGNGKPKEIHATKEQVRGPMRVFLGKEVLSKGASNVRYDMLGRVDEENKCQVTHLVPDAAAFRKMAFEFRKSTKHSDHVVACLEHSKCTLFPYIIQRGTAKAEK